ncbi:hypothetical protein QJS10_CPB13g00445 [Acorus calamus]|uniref:Uncharacterized protein n=1 Tax=Acorus calamus TaxID=4465 RepID=A0AAV9DJG9_ACOCL|nr:hypothetical protein QJS10_CPB13g00445 [Acorus calamus]
MSSFAFAVRARPLQTLYEGNGGFQGFIDVGLSKWSVKTRGPSRGGKGHAFTTEDVLGGIKNFGPSPGRGHNQDETDHHKEKNKKSKRLGLCVSHV